jgi:UDP-N-acetylglucosamine 2-epimerase (non-hydrolysing)
LKKIISVVGARPNFMKVAPIHKSFLSYNGKIEHHICHTGQHYDENMSKIFFEDLELPHPDYYLGVGSGSHSVQTAKIMIEFEKVLLSEKPEMIIVVGDVNSTIACSLVASKLGIKVVHVEAGLRSFDRTMPEEINRILTDTISDFLFVTEPSGLQNLKNEGIPESKVHYVGNVMIDSLITYLPKAGKSDIFSKLGVGKNKYILITLHRPSNVDSEKFLRKLVHVFNSLSERLNIVFPVHPRTRKNMEEFGLVKALSAGVLLTEPIGYIDFLALTKETALVVTDSGGIQEESTYLGVQCITVRDNTERPITVELGTNQLVGTDLDAVQRAAESVLDGNIKRGRIPELWDGKTAERIAKILTTGN